MQVSSLLLGKGQGRFRKLVLPSLGEGSEVGLRGVGGRSPLSVNFFHLRFGIASENHYLCRRESGQVLSLFSFSFANLRVIYRKRGCNLRQITV